MKHTVLLLVGCGLLSGCSTAPLAVNGGSFVVTTYKKHSRSTKAGLCGVRVGVVEDARAHKASLGWVAGRTVEAEDLPGMVERGLLHGLNRMDFVVSSVDDIAQEARLDLDVQIIKAYIKSVSTSMTSNIVVKFRVSLPDGRQEYVTVRGHDTSLNWASGDREIASSLSDAVLDSVDKARPMLAKHCDQLKLAHKMDDT